MSSCETFQGFFTTRPVLSLGFRCHEIVASAFHGLVSPITFSVSGIAHSLQIEDTSFHQIQERTIVFSNKEGTAGLRKICICSGKGFADRYDTKHGMALNAYCMRITNELSSFALFDGYGKISYSVQSERGEMKHLNESNNKLSDYISFYFSLSDIPVSYLSLTDSIGSTNGIEFSNYENQTNHIENSNFVRVVIFSLPDQNGNSPGLVIAAGTNVVAKNIYIANCKCSYFICRGRGRFSLGDIYCDEPIGTASSIEFVGTIGVGPGVEICKYHFGSCRGFMSLKNVLIFAPILIT